MDHLIYCAGMDGHVERGLRDETLIAIASDIETDEHVHSLGIAFGNQRAEIERYLTTNNMTGRKTYKGTQDMLFNWRLKTSPRDHRNILRKALEDSGLTLIAERYLGASVLDNGNCNLHGIDTCITSKYRKYYTLIDYIHTFIIHFALKLSKMHWRCVKLVLIFFPHI